MSFCSRCGKEISEGTNYCPNCGASVNAAQQTPVPAQEKSAEYDAKKDASDNMVFGILAYFGILVLIPILAAKESKFARFHSNQGLILFIACIAYGIVLSVLSSIILGISWNLWWILSILRVGYIFFAVLAILGIINAAKGEEKELPVLGKFKILK